MGKYMGNVPRLLDINAKSTDVKFPDVRGIVDLVMLPDIEDPHSYFPHRPRMECGKTFRIG